MPRATVESFHSSALRYERGHSGSASFAARPSGARRRSRSAARRCEGSARSAGNRAAGTLVPDARLGTLAALHSAQLGIQRRPPDSVERAAPSKCCAPAVRRASTVRPALRDAGACSPLRSGNLLDLVSVFSYVARHLNSPESPLMSTERIDRVSNFPKPYLSVRELSALTPWTEQAIRTMI